MLFSPSYEQLPARELGGLDSGGSPAGALPAPAAQVPVGQRARQMSTPERSAVVLLSGGLDSATVLAIARRSGVDTPATRCPWPMVSGTRQSSRPPRASRQVLGAHEHRLMQRGSRRHRRLGAHRYELGRTRASDGRRYPSRMCQPAIRSCFRSRSPGPRCSRRRTSSSASTPSTGPAIPTVDPSSSPHSSNSPPVRPKSGVEGRVCRIQRAAHFLVQGADHSRGRATGRGLCPDGVLLPGRCAGKGLRPM